MPIACKICIAEKGLKGSDIKDLPQTDDELVIHIEKEHHIPVRKPGETEEETLERFSRENPTAGTDDCKCPVCAARKTLGWL